MDHLIRAEQPGDAQRIHELLAQAFRTDQEARLVDRLRENRRLIVSLVADIDGIIAGYIGFSPVTIDHPQGSSSGAGLAPLAVDPLWRSRGIAAQLVTQGLFVCANAGIGFVVVLGEPEFYRRFDFRKASLIGIDNVYGVDEPFMVTELRTNCVRPGVAHYAPEFAALT